jgi:hypothetical protein
MASFVLPLVSGLAGLFGSSNKSTTNSNSNSINQTQTQNQQQSQSGFNYNPLQTALMNNFSNSANNQLNNATNLTPYTQSGLQNIQGQGQANQTALSANLASRGLSSSPAAATALTQNQLNTGNQEQNFMAQIPLLQNQLQTQAQQNAEAAFRTPGVATTSSGTSGGTTLTQGANQGTSTTTGQVNPLAGLLGGLGGALGAQGSGGLLSLLSSLFSGGGVTNNPIPGGIPGLDYQG